MQKLDQEGKFVVNGLSDVRKGLKGESESESINTKANQGFDVKYDRSVCPIPWWQDSLSSSLTDASNIGNECSNTEKSDTELEDGAILDSIQLKLQRLRRDLAGILDRPTMLDSNLGHVSVHDKSLLFLVIFTRIASHPHPLHLLPYVCIDLVLGMLLLKVKPRFISSTSHG